MDLFYIIYALSDPHTNAIRYVGMSKNVQRRYQDHCTCADRNLQKNTWIQGLLQENLAPILFTLETVTGRRQARAREDVWIHHFEALGMPLTNWNGLQYRDGGTREDNPVLAAIISQEIMEGRQ